VALPGGLRIELFMVFYIWRQPFTCLKIQNTRGFH